jgi:glycosyltransferase involved in cell wall biosynthesis
MRNIAEKIRLSIIIPNYNYADFVGKAIESALAVDWPDVEIIVVDDGSTDASRDVIKSFGKQITAIFQDNATQRVACNTGFAHSSGNVIIFLDSDDILEPQIAREIAAAWGTEVSKVQVQMARIDANGRKTGSVFPAFDPLPTPQSIRDWCIKVAAYPTPPGSGNAYARWFLEKLFPLDNSCGNFSDSACLATAPFFGDVVTIAKPLVLYRVHGSNDSNLSADDRLFAREIARAQAKLHYTQRITAPMGITLQEKTLFKSLHLLSFRVASLKLRPREHPLAEDGLARAAGDAVQALWSFPAASLKIKFILTSWAIITLSMPKGLARWLIIKRFRLH